MDLSFLNQTEYLLDVWARYVADNPAAPALTDERHPRGLSRRKVDELSARVYAWLREKHIGREDFVFLCLPRGAVALIAILGVWKAGAAFTLVEDSYPPERIAFIKKDCAEKFIEGFNDKSKGMKLSDKKDGANYKFLIKVTNLDSFTNVMGWGARTEAKMWGTLTIVDAASGDTVAEINIDEAEDGTDYVRREAFGKTFLLLGERVAKMK